MRFLAIALMCGAMIGFTGLDTSAKWLSASLPITQIIWTRYVGASLIALAGSRVLEDGYGVNHVAMAVPKGLAGRLAYVDEFVAWAKTSGAVGDAIARGALRGFAVSDRRQPALG